MRVCVRERERERERALKFVVLWPIRIRLGHCRGNARVFEEENEGALLMRDAVDWIFGKITPPVGGFVNAVKIRYLVYSLLSVR